MTGSDVERAATEMVSVLGPRTGADWRVPAGSLDWTCWTTAAHVAHDLLAYAAQVAAQPSDAYLPLDLRARGLALRWLPPAGLSALVLARLFPDSPSGPAPQVLLWSAGRLALPDRPRRTSWSWRAALAPSATPAATATTTAGPRAARTDR
ncbi:hypothetical protein ABZZ20_27690 [Streptomyces sp. NPDC006430]|uniref:hypothetical protein n=1 Tax=Streptomyces sp. NPDC006430 TaxID=3154299 RepID=UPI0033B4F9F9